MLRQVAHPTRREFAKQATLLGFGTWWTIAGMAAGSGCRRRPRGTSPGSSAGPVKLVTFSEAQFLTLQAATERLLPRDEAPGALDLGVPEYIDHMLASADLAAWRNLLTKLLPVLDRQAKKQFQGKLFHELPAADQDHLLAKWQRGAAGERRFFEVLLSLTFEGAFGDPKYGGNRGGQGYVLVGFTPGPPMPSMRLRAHDAHVPR